MRPLLTATIALLILGVLSGCGSVPPVLCAVNDVQCVPGENAQMTCNANGSGWIRTDCPQDQLCSLGKCVPRVCTAGDKKCENNAIMQCNAAGSGWVQLVACESTQTCDRGTCLDQSCTAGEKTCVGNSVMICAAAGASWEENVCPEGKQCFFGECVACLNNHGCPQGSICDKGECITPELKITTEALPQGSLNSPYEFTLAAVDGVTPYTWKLSEGGLPAGMELLDTGVLKGTPLQIGSATIKIEVTDQAANTDEKAFTLTILGEGLKITSDTFPEGEEGFEYAAKLEATGGTTPYAWMISTGALPAGLVLHSDGTIAGIPSEVGAFPFTAKVFDNGTTPDVDSKDFILNVKVAPLEIYGDRDYNLIITRIVVLKTLYMIGSVAIPYNDQLTAKGGLRPYVWTEKPCSTALSWLIPNCGLPAGLTVSASGEVSGSVSNTAQVSEITIPVINITLKGFFFSATVTDSQNPADSDEAVFYIPTL